MKATQSLQQQQQQTSVLQRCLLTRQAACCDANVPFRLAVWRDTTVPDCVLQRATSWYLVEQCLVNVAKAQTDARKQTLIY